MRRLRHEWRGGIGPRVGRLCEALDDHVANLVARSREYAELPELVIHGDYYAENLIMEGDEIVGVIDYDQAHWCWRALEVAEALIYFAREPGKRLRHIVYPGALDLDAVRRFLSEYCSVVCLSDAEINALPLFVRTIWMCAALDPPLRPRPNVQAAPLVLPEVLYLAEWAQAHAAEIREIGLDVRARVRAGSNAERPAVRKEVLGRV
jgi:Ser/Thr protein kinase RdoA (MazF antagonist)